MLLELPPQQWTACAGGQEALPAPRGRGATRPRTPAAELPGVAGTLQPLPGRIGHGDEVCGEVAAVHGRNVARLQRTQIAGVVPVVEVAANTLEALHGFERCFQPLHRLDGSDPAEIPGADDGQQVEADIRGRGSMGQHRARVLLEVVRRQHVIFCRDEGLEVPPRAACDQAQCERVRIGYREVACDPRGAADPQRDGRGRRATAARTAPRSTPRAVPET